MKNYTLGIVFDKDFNRVILLEKTRPEWQKGRLNCPGGHIEEGESSVECVSREFREECEIDIPNEKWLHIGRITNNNNYYVDILASTVSNTTIPVTLTDEQVNWYNSKILPHNVLSNIKWLIPFAENCLKQGNNDFLKFGTFEYK